MYSYPLGVFSLPWPLKFPALNSPTQYPPSLNSCFPSPSFKSFWKYPQQQSPLPDLYVPQPCFMFSVNCPSQTSPLSSFNTPLPWKQLFRNSPSQLMRILLFTIVLKFPLPDCCPSLNSPRYTAPLLNLISPGPCIVSLTKYPSYLSPLGKISLPYPSFSPPTMDPQQLDPSLNDTVPCTRVPFLNNPFSWIFAFWNTPSPWNWNFLNSPLQVLPSVYCICAKTHYPSINDPSRTVLLIQTIFPFPCSLPFLAWPVYSDPSLYVILLSSSPIKKQLIID